MKCEVGHEFLSFEKNTCEINTLCSFVKYLIDLRTAELCHTPPSDKYFNWLPTFKPNKKQILIYRPRNV